ncbi:hypothetical protein [Actinoplanes sp. NPDC049265]|uniref:hypothetical protein n=1 Tax=Actinoplanes sp. NPDC049265 TaxID=3363902 RepID=UPI0037122975
MSEQVAATGLDQLRARVRADRRTVTAPLLMLGGLAVLHAVAWIAAPGPAARHTVLFAYWPVAGAVALFGLWAYANRVADRDGVGGGRRSYRPIALGYLVSLPLLAILFLPAFLLGVFGPLLWPAMILWAVAARQHNQTLRTVAKALALAGAVQLVLALVTSTAGGVAAAGAAYALDLLAAAGLLAGAVITTRRAR